DLGDPPSQRRQNPVKDLHRFDNEYDVSRRHRVPLLCLHFTHDSRQWRHQGTGWHFYLGHRETGQFDESRGAERAVYKKSVADAMNEIAPLDARRSHTNAFRRGLVARKARLLLAVDSQAQTVMIEAIFDGEFTLFALET